MKIKYLIFGLLLVLLLAVGIVKTVHAAEENSNIVDETIVSEEDVVGSENEEVENTADYSEIIDAIDSNFEKHTDEVKEQIRTIHAMMLILVVFETLRIVRGWSKGVGVK